jgi:outer membrane cobalamin receptor
MAAERSGVRGQCACFGTRITLLSRISTAIEVIAYRSAREWGAQRVNGVINIITGKKT